MVITYTVSRPRESRDEAQAVFFHSLAADLKCRKKEATARLEPARLHVKDAVRDLTKPL